MSTKIPSTAHKLDASAVAAMIARAEADGSADSWRSLALMMADAMPAAKKPSRKKTGRGEYARVRVTFADGVSQVVGTYDRTKSGAVDLAAAERGAVFFRKCAAWDAARLALGMAKYRASFSAGDWSSRDTSPEAAAEIISRRNVRENFGFTWVRTGGRDRLVPPAVEIPAIIETHALSKQELAAYRRARSGIESQAPAFASPLRMSARMRDAVAAFIGHGAADVLETVAPPFGAKVADPDPVRCQGYDDEPGAFDFSAMYGSVNAFAAMAVGDVA